VVRRSQQGSPEALRLELVGLLSAFQEEIARGDLRERVLALVPAFHTLRDLGASMVEPHVAASASDRILHYFRTYPRMLISGDELMVVSGIGEWARRVRELRVQSGWRIVSGVTLSEMSGEDDVFGLLDLEADEYMLLDDEQDREAAHRWHVANRIRKQPGGVKKKLLAYFKENVGQTVTGEELRYVAGDKKEWARRIRELRTEEGWPIVTQVNGRPDLPMGVYLLEADRQAPEHDRAILDDVRREVLRRDHYSCTRCGWNHDLWNRSDPRHLEAHHIKQHLHGGDQTVENLTTLCTVCHDVVHRDS
jgi:hypothetical protein